MHCTDIRTSSAAAQRHHEHHRCSRAFARRAWLPCVRSILLVLLAALGASAQAQVSKEYQVKVAFLYNFTKFVEWPAQSFARADSPFVMGLYCPEPVYDELDHLIKGRKIGSREVVAKKLEFPSDAGSAQMLFVCANEDSQMNRIRAAVGSFPALIVTESDRAKKFSTINFTLQDEKIKFEVDMADADRSAIKISAQLLKLAISVRKDH
jgi:hypothetical protein